MGINIKKIIRDKLYLINEKWIIKYKNHFDYQNLIKELQINPIVNQIIGNLSPNIDLSKILNDKKLALIIKTMNNNINEVFNQKETSYQTCEEISPELGAYNYTNEKKQPSSLFYYNNFELINQNYFVLDSYYYQNKKNNNFIECFFIDGLVMLKLPSNVSNIFHKTVFEVGEIDENNIFLPKYFLICNHEYLLENYINNIINNIGYIKDYFNSLQFKKGESLSLNDLNENKNLCLIYKFYEENDNNDNNQINNNQVNNNSQINNNVQINIGNQVNNNYIYNFSQDNDIGYVQSNFINV